LQDKGAFTPAKSLKNLCAHNDASNEGMSEAAATSPSQVRAGIVIDTTPSGLPTERWSVDVDIKPPNTEIDFGDDDELNDINVCYCPIVVQEPA